MKYLQKYNIFEGKAEDKALKKIQKFFKDELVAKKAVDLSPKLSIWIINQFMNKCIEEISDNRIGAEMELVSKKDIENYFKTGNSNIEIKKLVSAQWNNYYSSKFQYILDWVNSFDISIEDRKNFTNLSFDQAYEKSEKWHKSLKAGGKIKNEHGKVLMTFPDGFYWIDLETTYDRAEADAMGHCGNTTKGDTLYSLRDRNKSSHVTAAIDEVNGIVYQMKGRNNKKPIDKYHLYIVGLLGNDDLEYPLRGFGAEYDKNNDFNPEEDLDSELLSELKEKRPNIDDPVHTPEEISTMFDNMIESYYLQSNEPEYGFRLVEWCYDVAGFDSVIYCLIKSDWKLFDILCEEYPEKVEKDIPRFKDQFEEEEKIGKIMLDLSSSYINPDEIVDKYNIELSKPNASTTAKWDEIYKYIGNEGLESELKDAAVWHKFQPILDEKYPKLKYWKDEFISYPYHWNRELIKIDYKAILNHFFDYDDKKIIQGLYDLFDDSEQNDENYHENIWDVFDAWDLVQEIKNKLSTEEMENELLMRDWYEYTGEWE